MTRSRRKQCIGPMELVGEIRNFAQNFDRETLREKRDWKNRAFVEKKNMKC
jgi:hypothetical protein